MFKVIITLWFLRILLSRNMDINWINSKHKEIIKTFLDYEKECFQKNVLIKVENGKEDKLKKMIKFEIHIYLLKSRKYSYKLKSEFNKFDIGTVSEKV